MKRQQFKLVGTTLACLVMALCVVALKGCGGSSGTQISVGTAPLGGAFYQVGSAISGALNDAKDAGWSSASPQGTKGTLDNLKLLSIKDIQLGLANSTITYMAVRGEGGFKKKYEVKTIMTMFPLIAMFVTKKSNNIKSIADLKGKRVAIGPQGGGFNYFVEPILEAHGLKLSDIEVVNASFQASVGQLQDDSIAAAFLGGGKKSPSISTAASTMKGEMMLIPYDEKARDKLDKEYPSFNKVTVAANTYGGQTKPFAGLNVGAAHLLVRSDADETLVYNMTKVIYNARKAIADQHPLGKSINPKNVVRNTGTEFHAGAVKFYKEIKIWDAAGKKGGSKGTKGTSKKAAGKKTKSDPKGKGKKADSKGKKEDSKGKKAESKSTKKK